MHLGQRGAVALTALMICTMLTGAAAAAGVYIRIDNAVSVARTAADTAAHDAMVLLATSPDATRLSIEALAGGAPCSWGPQHRPAQAAECRALERTLRDAASRYGAEITAVQLGPDVRDIYPATAPGRLTILVEVSFPGPLAANRSICGFNQVPYLCKTAAVAAAQEE